MTCDAFAALALAKSGTCSGKAAQSQLRGDLCNLLSCLSHLQDHRDTADDSDPEKIGTVAWRDLVAIMQLDHADRIARYRRDG